MSDELARLMENDRREALDVDELPIEEIDPLDFLDDDVTCPDCGRPLDYYWKCPIHGDPFPVF